jgi:hypothetical protein
MYLVSKYPKESLTDELSDSLNYAIYSNDTNLLRYFFFKFAAHMIDLIKGDIQAGG